MNVGWAPPTEEVAWALPTKSVAGRVGTAHRIRGAAVSLSAISEGNNPLPEINISNHIVYIHEIPFERTCQLFPWSTIEHFFLFIEPLICHPQAKRTGCGLRE